MRRDPGAAAGGRPPRSGSPLEVFGVFLKLGLTAFGGPSAHLGYFRDELVTRRRWVSEATYADLVALCQFLPGPASSQVGYAMGLLRGGPLGGVAAWCAFTLPSAAILVAFALGAAALDGPVGSGLAHGLGLVAVAIVAHAVTGMARTLTPDGVRAGIALAAAAIVLSRAGVPGPVLAIALGALAGLRLCRSEPGATAAVDEPAVPVSRRTGLFAFALFAALLAGLPVAAAGGSHGVALVDAFYRAGALVFGGGHVVLPLLKASVVEAGWIDPGRFLAGYGAAQAVPGPLFTVAAYLGAAMTPGPNGVVGAALCLCAVFLPGLLLVTAALPFWAALRARAAVRAALRGANAAVVGILAAALYDPVWTGAVATATDAGVALAGFVLLAAARVAPWGVVLLGGAFGVAAQVIGVR